MEDNLYNSDFVELVSNEEFVLLVIQSLDAEKLLADMLSKYPENENNLRYAVEFVLLAQTEKTEISNADSDVLLKTLQDRLTTGKSSRFIFHRWTMLKIASVVLVFLAIGAVFYSQYAKDPLKQFAENNILRENQSVIVLSDGSKHILAQSEMNIDYKSKQGEVIVQNEENQVTTIENKSEENEELLNQVIVPFGQRQKLMLSDGTSVELNAGSKLVFPAAFTGKERAVYLVGEGYFDVHKDREHPFIVKTDFIDVKVFGTQFNLAAYSDEGQASTVLVEGSVSVAKNGGLFGTQSLFLSPGEACFYSNNDKKLNVRDVDVDFYTSWKNGVYNFRDEPLSYVIKKVMKYYNVQINVPEENILNTKLSGKLRITGNIDEVVQYIAKTIEGRYEKEIDGKYILYKH